MAMWQHATRRTPNPEPHPDTMTTLAAIPAKAAALFARMTTAQIAEAFDMTDTNNAPEIPTARGWMMDELEAREPQKFAAWMEYEGTTKTAVEAFA